MQYIEKLHCNEAVVCIKDTVKLFDFLHFFIG